MLKRCKRLPSNAGKTLLAANNMPLQSSDIAYLAVLTAVDRLNTQLGIL